MVYLDNSATTPLDPDVIRVMGDVMEKVMGNPSSLHGVGGKAERLVKQSREVVAKSLGVSPNEVIFTSGGTEGNNMAIKGVAWQYRNRGRHLITTEVEHPSVYEVFGQLADLGWKVTYLPVDEEGCVDPEAVEQALTDETVLVSVMHVNNETGTIQPVEAIGCLLRKHPKVLFHVDGVQAFGKVPLKPKEWGIDLLTLSAHKFHGPKGTGCLILREGVTLFPLLAGGGQEGGLRSGTLNVPGIAGLAKAAALASQRRTELAPRLMAWKQMMVKELQASLTHMKVNGDLSEAGGAPHILSLSFPGLKSEVIVHALEEKGVVVSSKSACSSKGEKPSRILKAMGLDDAAAIGSIRISMGAQTTEADVRRGVDALKHVIPKLQQVMKGHGL